MKDTKEHILHIAVKLFLTKSYKEVTLKEIVQHSGLSKGAFYHYFTSKEELFGEILETYFNSFLENYYSSYRQDSLKNFYNDHIERMMSMLVKLGSDFGIDMGLTTVNFYFMMFDGFNLIPRFRERVIKAHELERNTWTAIIRSARANGEIDSPLSDELIAQLFIYVGDGSSLNMIVYQTLDELAAKILALWDGLYLMMKTDK